MREALIRVDEIPLAGAATVHLSGREVLVMMLNGKPRAFANVCMHHAGPLERTGDTLTCRWHGARYEVRTGRAISGPVRPDARLIMLPTRVEDGVLTDVYNAIKPQELSTSPTISTEKGREHSNSQAETRGATGEEISRR